MISGIHAQALLKRYEQLKLVEFSKNDLIEVGALHLVVSSLVGGFRVTEG